MPADDPQFGEVWTTMDMSSGRIMQGIIADIAPTRVLFVSLVGNRVAVPLSRMRTNWTFASPAPRRTLPPCERVGCQHGGMIEYSRSDRVIHTCPKHAPASVQCRITVNYQPPAELRSVRPGFECRSTPCPTCGDRDPAEDVRLTAAPARFWLCTSCSNRWVTIPRIPEVEQDFDQIGYNISHELGRLSYEADSLIILHQTSWASLESSVNVQRDSSGAVPRLLLRNMQALLDASVVTEQVREFFHAIVRVRSSAIRRQERPVQRLGGSPNRGGVVGGQREPVRVSQVPNTMVYRPPAPETETMAVNHAAAASLRQLRLEDQQHRTPPPRDIFDAAPLSETPLPDFPIDVDSLWVQRQSGGTVAVLSIVRATDGSDVISFRRTRAEQGEASVPMSRRDFLLYHRPHGGKSETESNKPTPLLVEVSIDEEWRCQDGSSMVVTRVDHRKEIIFGDDLKTKKHRQIPFVQFISGRWKKIVRRSVYDRLRKPEIGLGGTEDD